MSLPTLDIRTVARLVGMNDGVLYSWVRKRTVTPAVLGTHGRWAPHHFSVAQVLALCFVAADKAVLTISKNMTLRDVSDRIAEVENDLAGADIEGWVNGSPSPWEEELAAAQEGDDEVSRELAAQNAL